MLGKRSKQLGFLEADHLYLDYVGRGSFYGVLASLRGQLFRDEDFAELYCPDNGRDSVPPSLVATALLLPEFRPIIPGFQPVQLSRSESQHSRREG